MKGNGIKKFIDENGTEQIIAMETEIQGRKFVITTGRKLFEKDKEGNCKECKNDDEVTKTIKKYLEPPKSLDIEIDH